MAPMIAIPALTYADHPAYRSLRSVLIANILFHPLHSHLSTRTLNRVIAAQRLKFQERHAIYRRELECELSPGVAVICAMPDLAIAQTSVDMASYRGIGQERVGHGVERLWQPA